MKRAIQVAVLLPFYVFIVAAFVLVWPLAKLLTWALNEHLETPREWAVDWWNIGREIINQP